MENSKEKHIRQSVKVKIQDLAIDLMEDIKSVERTAAMLMSIDRVDQNLTLIPLGSDEDLIVMFINLFSTKHEDLKRIINTAMLIYVENMNEIENLQKTADMEVHDLTNLISKETINNLLNNSTDNGQE